MDFDLWFVIDRYLQPQYANDIIPSFLNKTEPILSWIVSKQSGNRQLLPPKQIHKLVEIL